MESSPLKINELGESSFYYDKGGMKILRGALKICILQNQQERGAPKKIEPLVRGAAKISSFKFQYLHPPSCHIK